MLFDNFACVHGVHALAAGVRLSLNLRASEALPRLGTAHLDLHMGGAGLASPPDPACAGLASAAHLSDNPDQRPDREATRGVRRGEICEAIREVQPLAASRTTTTTTTTTTTGVGVADVGQGAVGGGGSGVGGGAGVGGVEMGGGGGLLEGQAVPVPVPVPVPAPVPVPLPLPQVTADEAGANAFASGYERARL